MFGKVKAVSFCCLAVILFSNASFADDSKLAPPLKVTKWIKGEPVPENLGDSGKVHVIEVWATWCVPCVANFPRMSAMQEKFIRDAIFVGLSYEAPEIVESFVKNQGDKISYRIATDAGGELTLRHYDKLFELTAIPRAYIIDRKGAIVWEGNPSIGMEEVLAQVIAGSYTSRFIVKSEAAEKIGGLSWAFVQLHMAGELDLSKAVLARIGELAQENNGELFSFVFEVSMSAGPMRLMRSDAQLRALLELIELSNAIAKGRNPTVLDIYAQVVFKLGKRDQAIALEEKAIELADEKMDREEYEGWLKLMKTKNPSDPEFWPAQ